jgi:membrane protein implicated in regulation of membrane protease activity
MRKNERRLIMKFESWWIWMGLAAILLIGEIFTAGFFLLWFSIGAAGAGILALLGVGRPAQIIVFILASGILFVFGRRFAERVTEKQPPGIGADRFINKEGIVLDKIDNETNSGRIRIGQDEWRASSETGDVIPQNTRVVVTRIEGTHAIVKTIEKEDE